MKRGRFAVLFFVNHIVKHFGSPFPNLDKNRTGRYNIIISGGLAGAAASKIDLRQ